MSVEARVTEEVKDVVNNIISKHKLNPNSDVVYSAGSQVGDGYMSKTVIVDIIDENETIHLFIKCALDIQSDEMSMENVYANEVYFYDVILPKYLKFGEERGVKEAFKNAPRCFGTTTKNSLAMENLRKKNFELFDRKNNMNDNHIVSMLNVFADYHAISFAFKDQDEDVYKEITNGVLEVFNYETQVDSTVDMVKRTLNDLQNQLDDGKDKLIKDKCDDIVEKIQDYCRQFGELRDKYSVITKGDCWNNNMMFRYEEGDKTKPAEVMLIDWQLISIGSVVIDVGQAFYTVASKEKLNNLTYYMKLYHEELSKSIRQLGSDPETLYPYSVFEKEWKQHSLFGYFMALIAFNANLVSKEEMPDIEETSKQNKSVIDIFSHVECTPEYYRRLKDLTEHFISHNFF